MLPVVAGRAATTRQILIYSVLLVPVSVLPWGLGFAGAIYGVVAAICGALFVLLAWQLRRAAAADRRAAHRLFAFSIVYLFVLFAALLADNGGNRWSSMPSGRAAPTAVGSVQRESVARPVLTASFTKLRADEV
jgi:heme o synthase